MLRKRFGQHFLEPAWVRKVVDAVAPAPGDRVIEIGPGGGALTLALAPRVARFVAVEIDRDLAADLMPRLPAHASLVVGDILDLDLAALAATLGPGPVRIVGNLPYNISSPILFRLLAAHGDGLVLSDATLMLQREVAHRLAAAPGSGDYGVLAAQAALTARVDVRLELPPGAFRPPPKVQSSVVRLTFHPADPPVADRARFETLVRGVFTLRRKTMLNALRHVVPVDAPAAEALLLGAGIDPASRPGDVPTDAFVRLADSLSARL